MVTIKQHCPPSNKHVLTEVSSCPINQRDHAEGEIHTPCLLYCSLGNWGTNRAERQHTHIYPRGYRVTRCGVALIDPLVAGGGGGGGIPYIFHIHMCRQNAPLCDDFSLAGHLKNGHLLSICLQILKLIK